jgi:hypothetical protein
MQDESPPIEPIFGSGKQYVQVAPLPGSAYSGTPDMSGAHIVVTDTSNSNNVVLDCFTTPGGFCGGGPLGWFEPMEGHTYSISQSVASDGTGAPRGFMGAATFSYTPAETGCVEANSVAVPQVSLCNYPDIVLLDPGAYRTISLTISSSVNAATKLGGATYHLCSITTGAPVVTGPSCPATSTELDHATTDANGQLTFPSVYVPANDPENPLGKYTVFETATTPGYITDANARIIEVPAAFANTGTGSIPIQTAAANAHTQAALVIPVLNFAFTNAPDVPAPVAVNDGASTPNGAAIVVPVETNDNGQGAPITLVSVTAPAHGTAVIADGAVTYTPAAGFSGTDTFTYTISTRGGTATATVTVIVAAPLVAAVVLPVLASTGSPDLAATYGGLAVLTLGGALTVAAHRRRTTRH